MEIVKVSATEALQLGKTFFDSGMFTDLKNAQQAIVKIMAGAEIGIPPFASMSGIHVIQGKPTIGAGLMSSMVKASGKYDYRVTESSETKCSIDFYQGKEKIGNSSFTAEDAKKAGTKNMDKFAKNMLFARAMSNGVRWFTPDVFAGPVYTPDEMNDVQVTEDVPHTDLPTPPGATGTKAEIKKQTPLSDKAIGEAVVRIQKGEADLIDKLKETFALTQPQIDTLEAARPATT